MHVYRQKGPGIRIISQLISRLRTTIATMKLFTAPIIIFYFARAKLLLFFRPKCRTVFFPRDAIPATIVARKLTTK